MRRPLVVSRTVVAALLVVGGLACIPLPPHPGPPPRGIAASDPPDASAPAAPESGSPAAKE